MIITRKYYLTFIIFLIFNSFILAQTTGKIAGKVFDAETNEPLIGANIVVEGTNYGAASNIDGEFYIINIPPGKYNVRISMVGFTPVTFKDVVVSVNRTSSVETKLKIDDYSLDEIVVSVDAVTKKKDQTSSVKNISSDQITQLPVENIDDVIEMQAGVVQGHFRGGRTTEVSYLVDGVSITDNFNRSSNDISIETEAIQDLEVITGTFNAEYGRAMSGIVNIVTKEGGDQFAGSFYGYLSNYITQNDNIFLGVKPFEVTRNQDYKLQIEGPIYSKYINFFANVRYQKNLGHLNGIRRFLVNDYSNFGNANKVTETTKWDYYVDGDKYYSEHNGDESYVPMNTDESYSVISKITLKPFVGLKTSFMYSLNNSERQYYQHFYKYKPDGRKTFYENSQLFMAQFNHIISNDIFHDLKIAYKISKNEDYLYKNPLDKRYNSVNYNSSVGGFASGGQDLGYEKVALNDLNIKYDFNWQINQNHSIKTGVNFTSYKLQKENINVRDKKFGSSELEDFSYDENLKKLIFNPFEPEIDTKSYKSDNYEKEPYEISAYVQEKMEFDDLVINYGVRYDYFDANTLFPTQLRNPDNALSFPDNPERMSKYEKTKPQSQISPRFGLSYTLGEAAVLRFSYGHFFQMPPLYALFQNSRFLIPTGNFETILGNPNIKAEKTVQYELGIWQEIVPQMGLELSVFYRDIYDLQSAIVITTYNGVKYGLFSNKDYGNVKGLEIKYDYLFGDFSLLANYTLQFTKGNADNPTSTFSRAGQSLDAIPKLIPLEWDQRHTFNASLSYDKENYGVTLTGYYNSGLAYTFQPIPESKLSKQTLFPNNQHKPSRISLDLKGYYDLNIFENTKLRLSLLIYNLFDQLNEERVNSTTGRAYSAILNQSQIATFKSNYNNIYDAVKDPSMYSAPREIKFGIGIIF